VKWVFLLALLICTPALAGLLRSKPHYLVHGCFVLGVSVLLLGPSLTVTPIGLPTWPAPVKGYEISFIDGISLAFIASTRSVRIPWTVKLGFLSFCFALVVSTFAAYQVWPALFYAWQLFRTALLFFAISRVCAAEQRAIVALLGGYSLGLVGEAGLVAWQYVHGELRPGGTFGHSNFMGLALDFVVFPTLALLLSSRKLRWPVASMCSALVIAVLGGSRATLGLLAIGVVLTILLSIRQKGTSRKYAFGGALLLLLLVSAPVMIWSVNQRSNEARASSDADRAAMKAAATMMIADHPFGVGANQYVVVANTGGYSERAGVAWNEDNRAAPVHDTYYLITAEMGFLGLIGLLAILGSFILLGFRMLRQKLPNEIMGLAPGLTAAMIVASVHISFEFVFMDFTLHYLFAMAGGMLVAITSRVRSRASESMVPVKSSALLHAR
jgi:hypothetical protein